MSGINFDNLFKNSEKCVKDINFEVKIDSLKDSGDFFIFDFKKNNIEYRGFSIMKGELFPNPKEKNIININKITYKYDEQFKLRLYVEAQINNNIDCISENQNNVIQSLDFNEDNIIKTLKKIFKINNRLFTNLFIVDSINENDYSIKCLENNEKYVLTKNNNLFLESLSNKNIILINDYYLENKNIILTPMSIVEKLDDEKLFYFLDINEEISNKFLWGKILELDLANNNFIYIIDKTKNIFKFQFTKIDDIKLGQFFLLSKYHIKNKTNEIIIDDNSFCYFSDQEVYFSNRISINLYTVVQFYFIDYKNNDNNVYNAIKLNDEIKRITDKEMNFIINHRQLKNYEFFIQNVSLLFNENNFSSNDKIFSVSVLQGFINRINVFINYKSNLSYYYEYLYYSYKDFDFLKIKTININEDIKNITIYDSFGSKNRIKFSILNIPFQEECPKESLVDINSILICETFYENPKCSKIFGIFNIREIFYNINVLKLKNNIYDKYYDEFGFVFDYLKSKPKNKEEIDNFVAQCLTNYNKYSETFNQLKLMSISLYEENISLNQLKARIGMISSYYLSVPNSQKQKQKIFQIFNNLKIIAETIENYENIFSNEQILRIFILLTKRIIECKFNPELIVLSTLDKESSPYCMAVKFNLEEINNINEYSRLFSGYLQMDSYILTNYNIKGENNQSYTFSIEPLFILKHHLISNYEGFFITERHNNNIIAWTDIDTRITIINEENLFGRSNLKDISFIEDNKTLKDHAFGVSIILRHEKNSHQKKNLKSGHIISPCFYCDNGETKKICFKNDDNRITGEDGILIESLIIENHEVIISLAKDFIYGELLDYRLFIGKDFNELKKLIFNIQEKNKKYFEENQSKNHQINLEEKNEMKEFPKDEGETIKKEEIMKFMKRREIELGDQIYSFDLIEEMIRSAKMRNQFDNLPSIIKEIDKELQKDKK